MSLHKSLKSGDALKRQRNVLTRVERITILKKDKRWSDGDSVFGLPKVRTVFKVRKGKPKAKAEEEETKTEE